MLKRLGPRLTFEVAFLVAVAAATAIVGLDAPTIVAVMFAAWVAVATAEWVATRSAPPRRLAAPAPAAEEPTAVRASVAPAAPEPPPAAVAPPPEPVVAAEPVRPRHDAAPEPPPVSAPPPVAPPVTAPPRAFEPPVVASLAPPEPPREWNLWELERLTRDRAGADPFQDEERGFLLVYLREFASPSGDLPVDFDGLVRESFAEIVGELATR